MARHSTSMTVGNTGLTVKVNLWPVRDSMNSEVARLRIKGQVTHADTKEENMFNDAGELVTILGKWNAQKMKELKKG